MELTGLAGARVMVTAGGSGIGKVVATRFAEAGAAVVSCDVDPQRAAALGAGDPPIAATVADVSREDEVDRLFDEAVARLGGLDVLVNNAGVGGPVACVDSVSPAILAWSRTSPGPERNVSMHPLRPQKHAAPGRSSSRGQGSGLWPHSPAMPLGPSRTRPSITMFEPHLRQ